MPVSNLEAILNSLEENFLQLIGDNAEVLTGVRDTLIVAFDQLDDIDLNDINTDAPDNLLADGGRILSAVCNFTSNGNEINITDLIGLRSGDTWEDSKSRARSRSVQFPER